MFCSIKRPSPHHLNICISNDYPLRYQVWVFVFAYKAIMVLQLEPSSVNGKKETLIGKIACINLACKRPYTGDLQAIITISYFDPKYSEILRKFLKIL